MIVYQNFVSRSWRSGIPNQIYKQTSSNLLASFLFWRFRFYSDNKSKLFFHTEYEYNFVTQVSTTLFTIKLKFSQKSVYFIIYILHSALSNFSRKSFVSTLNKFLVQLREMNRTRNAFF